MSVYTTVTPAELESRLTRYTLGALQELKGIAAGITNTNYFVTTAHGRFVLTLFETLKLADLPFYLQLMSHLARHNVPCPAPVADRTDHFASLLADKPACLVSCLSGRDVETPSPAQCRAVGVALAEMHIAGATFPQRMDNPRGPAWWVATARAVESFMPADDAAMLRQEINFQDNHRFDHLPSGIIHADLFRDNVLMDGDKVAGFIDFYYACNDILVYDVAITTNDWCGLPASDIDPERARALLAGYQSVRPLTDAEAKAWPVMLRAGGLRFWLSRLYDKFKPQSGEMTFTKDPAFFQHIIAKHRVRTDFWL